MTRRRFAVSTGALLVLGALALFERALFRAETFVARDLLSYYRPAKILLVRLLHEAGEIPLWNPYFSFGQPFAANPEHELFHPATTLLLLLPFEWAFRLPIILAPILAALAMLFFLRTVGRGREAAAIGALSWGFGGYLLSTFNLLPILYAVVPLPAALAFLVRTWRRGRWEDAAGLAVCGGLVGLAGEPSTLACAAVLGIVSLVAHGGRAGRWVPAATGVALACGIAAPSLIPGLLHVRLTERAAGLAPEFADIWSFPLARIAELALPRLFGHAEMFQEAWYWGRAFYPDREFPFLLGVYPGLLATALAAVALARRSRRVVPWTVGALAALAVAAGPPLGIWNALHRLPVVSGLRYPEKFLLVSCFAVVVLAATGWDLLRRATTRRRIRAVLIAFGAVTATAALALVFAPAPAGLVDAARAPLLGGILRRDLLVAAATATLTAAALGVPRRRRFVAAGVVLVAELIFVGRGFAKTRPIAQVRRPHPALAAIAARPPGGPVVGLFLDALIEPRPVEWGIATALGGDFDLTGLRWTGRATGLLWRAANEDASLLSPLLARRSVSALVMPRPDERGVNRVTIVRPAGRQPFAFFAPRVASIRSDEDWVAVVRRLGPAARETACLQAADARGVPPSPAAGRVTAVERTPDRIEMDVDTARSDGPGLLAINQTWAPGWRADVDGRPARLLRTDIDLTSMLVPPGARHVTLRYTDASVSASLAISLASLLATGLLVSRGRRRGAAP